MKSRFVLFVDASSLKQLQAKLPQLEVYSESIRAKDFKYSSPSESASYDISRNCYIPFPSMEFTKHHLKLSVKDACLQPLRVESGFLSFDNYLLTERNPTNQHLPSFSPLQRRSLPGLHFSWWPWNADAWRHVPGSRRSNLYPRIFNGPAHILTSFNNPNWYHWLTLPGLCSLPFNDNINSLIISDRSLLACKRSPNALLRKVATLAKALHPRCNCYFERGPLLIQELHACFIENHTSLVCDTYALQHLRTLSVALAASVGKIAISNKLYLKRGPSAKRPLHQEEYLEYALRQRGFDVIDPVNLSLPECISAFARADLIVAPHGAALTNLVFTRPGTKVLELLPGTLEKYGHYAFISAALGLIHSSITLSSPDSVIFNVNFSQILIWVDEQGK